MPLDVNDRTYDSGRAEIRFGSTAAAIQKIGFGDSLSVEVVRRIGSQEIAVVTEGQYETEDVMVTVEQSVWQKKILPKLPANGLGNFRFVITVLLSDPELGTGNVRLEKCRIIGIKDNIENSAGALVTELKINTVQIVRNGKTLNRRRGANTPAADNAMKL